mmetsp:Transcript_22299/g.62195  ORF Transcript_22299/g.62195 Transcript_22299/m.62195 type:complete len:100 (-) Transcript_22299:1100-1399(-)
MTQHQYVRNGTKGYHYQWLTPRLPTTTVTDANDKRGANATTTSLMSAIKRLLLQRSEVSLSASPNIDLVGMPEIVWSILFPHPHNTSTTYSRDHHQLRS